jgi:hypothetical protein
MSAATLKLVVLALLVLCGFTLLAIVLWNVREQREKDGLARLISGDHAPYRRDANPNVIVFTRSEKRDSWWLGDAIIVAVNVLTALLVVLVGVDG